MCPLVSSTLPIARRHQYTSITDWTGGLYISPGFAGSRSGALIATAWASLVHLGEDGFLAATGGLLWGPVSLF
jgi:sphinganine-1-phosphate aldolase